MSRRDTDPVAITVRRGAGQIVQGCSVANTAETIRRLAAVVPADAEWTCEVRCPGLDGSVDSPVRERPRVV